MSRALPLHLHIPALPVVLLLVGSIIGGVGCTFSLDIVEATATELSGRAGVHNTYAERFMKPEQIDLFDVEHTLVAIAPQADRQLLVL